MKEMSDSNCEKSSSSSSSSPCSPKKCKKKCKVTNKLAKKVECLWKSAFPDAALLKDASSDKVKVYTHTMGKDLLKINGLVSHSPLANNALYSWECARPCKDKHPVRYLNLYEIMIPDIPGKCGEPSTVEIYTKLLEDKYNLRVNGKHYHWEGAFLIPEATLVAAIHHSGIGISPCEFSRRTICALKEVECVIKERTHH